MSETGHNLMYMTHRENSDPNDFEEGLKHKTLPLENLMLAKSKCITEEIVPIWLR